MKVLLFDAAFVDSILSGVKSTTIRGRGRVVPGERLSFRVWHGVPYRPGSKQREFARATIAKVDDIYFNFARGYPVCVLGGVWLGMDERDSIARGEGFPTWSCLLDYFAKKPQKQFSAGLHKAFISWDQFERTV